MNSPITQAFEQLWSLLFTTPVHLDSALSKLPKKTKSALARITPMLLLRPISECESHGVGVPPEEPWNLSPEKQAKWKPASALAQRLYESHIGSMKPGPLSVPVIEDFPPYMWEEWKASWGEACATRLVEVLGQEAPLSLRAARSTGAELLLKSLTAGSRLPVKASFSELSPLGVVLSGYAQVMNTDLYESGAFEIQDEGSQVMSLFALWPENFAHLLQDKPGPREKSESSKKMPELQVNPPAWNVVDACAGAGGKSLAMADALKGKGRVYAYDISEVKLGALRRRAKRAGLRNIQTVALKKGAEQEVVGKFRARADVVLVDAPCTGWGVLRRNPDIKWRQGQEVLERMPEIQARLLSQYSELVAPGGRLVYGVCTFRHAETTEIIRDFLTKHPDFVEGPGGYLGPGPSSDGFYMKALSRRRHA